MACVTSTSDCVRGHGVSYVRSRHPFGREQVKTKAPGLGPMCLWRLPARCSNANGGFATRPKHRAGRGNTCEQGKADIPDVSNSPSIVRGTPEPFSGAM